MNTKAYWVSPKGEVYDLGQRHLDFIRDNKSLFKITDEEYRETFAKFGEKIGLEGKAREYLILQALKKGWIRARDQGNSGWSVEVWELDSYTKENLMKLINAFVGNPYSNINVHILKLERAGQPQRKWFIQSNKQEIVSGEMFEKRKVLEESWKKEEKLKTFEEFVK